MKKLIGILLTTVLTLSMSFNVFAENLNTNHVSTKSTQTVSTTPYSGIDIQLKEGETVKIPLKLNSLVTPNVPTTNSVAGINDGFVSVTREGTKVSYVITIFGAYTSMSGEASITDITSGLSCGSSQVYFNNGSVLSSGLSGHMYRFYIYGYAYMLGVPMASFEATAQWTH